MAEKPTTEELLALSVDKLTAQFGQLDDDTLQALADAEAKAEHPRSTLTAAIDAEKLARAAASEGKAKPSDDDGDEPVTYSQEELDAKLAEKDKEIAGLQAKLKDATKAPKRAVRAVPSDKPRKFGEPGGDGFDDAVTIAFVDRDGTTNPALPDLEFSANDFEPAVGGGRSLNRDIDFEAGTERVEIAAAVLLNAKGKPVSKCGLVQPLGAGGGDEARLPKGYLVFRPAEALDPTPDKQPVT